MMAKWFMSVDVLDSCHKSKYFEHSISILSKAVTSISFRYRFQLNLRCSKTIHSDIALHFDVRFYPENCVVRNTLVNESWGHEERHSNHFPFQPGASFDLMIRVESSRFMVAVNGSHFVEYNHRIHPFTKVDTFDISGDVNIMSVRFA